MRRRLVATLLVPAAAAAVLAAHAQDPPADAARRDAEAAVAADRRAQEAADAWDAERRALETRHAALQDETARLTARRAREEAAVDALADREGELQRRLVEADRLTASLEDTLAVLLRRLEDDVARDLPFLPEERARRLASLHETLDRPGTPAAEKLRRLLEAALVEAAYGGSVELVQDAIALDGRELHVEILRVGRLALFWRTPDGGRRGAWDAGAGAWIELPGDRDRAIAQAMEMAARRRAPAVVGLPIGRIDREATE